MLETHHVGFGSRYRNSKFTKRLQGGLQLSVQISIRNIKRCNVGVGAQPILGDDRGTKVPLITQHKRKPWSIKTCVITKQGRLQVKARDHRSLRQAQVGRNVFEHGQHFDRTAPQILGIILFGYDGWFADGCSFGLGVFGVRLGIFGPGFGVFGSWFGGQGVFEGLISQHFAQKGPTVVQGVHGDVEIGSLRPGVLNRIAQVAGR